MEAKTVNAYDVYSLARPHNSLNYFFE